MTDKDDIFLKKLQTQFTEVYKIAKENKYKILVPQKKFIIEAMLNRNFYENHIYKVCKYDDKMYINLNGKVLKLENKKFVSYLGWKKDMEFTIKDNIVADEDVSCILIDNVCDDGNYNKTSSSVNDPKFNIQRYTSMKEYVEKYTVQEYSFKEFKDTYELFDYKTDCLRNNIIFMKGHEEEYSAYFNGDIREIQDAFRSALSKNKVQCSYDILICELVDSLVFNKMYDFIYNSLVDFHKEDEEFLKTKLKEDPKKYDLALVNGLDKAYRNCKFENAVELLSKLDEKKNIWEKYVSLYFINILFRIY